MHELTNKSVRGRRLRTRVGHLHIRVHAIHRSLEETLGPDIFAHRYHDCKEQYANCLGKISDSDPAAKVYVVEEEGVLVAFVFTILDRERRIGEIGLNAVDPEHQRKGIGRIML